MENLLEKSIAFGKAIIATDETEVCLLTLYTIEDDAYFYVYCPEIGIFAYGSDITNAEENLANAIGVNFETLHKEGRIHDLYLNELENEYFEVIKELTRRRDIRNLKLIAERHFNSENTNIIHGVTKGPQLYYFGKQIELKLTHEKIKKDAA